MQTSGILSNLNKWMPLVRKQFVMAYNSHLKRKPCGLSGHFFKKRSHCIIVFINNNNNNNNNNKSLLTLLVSYLPKDILGCKSASNKLAGNQL